MKTKEVKTVKTQRVKKLFYTQFHVAGFGYWEGFEVYDKIKVGAKLNFARETVNPHDPNAVAIYYDDYKLGYVPKCCNSDICKFIDMGWDKLFETVIIRFNPDVHPEQQVYVNVYLKHA